MVRQIAPVSYTPYTIIAPVSYTPYTIIAPVSSTPYTIIAPVSSTPYTIIAPVSYTPYTIIAHVIHHNTVQNFIRIPLSMSPLVSSVHPGGGDCKRRLTVVRMHLNMRTAVPSNLPITTTVDQ